MSGIIRFLGKSRDSGTEKMLITQKNLKKSVKSFDKQILLIIMINVYKNYSRKEVKVLKDNTKSTIIATRLNKEFSQQFEEICKKNRRKRADLLRIIVEDYINSIKNE